MYVMTSLRTFIDMAQDFVLDNETSQSSKQLMQEQPQIIEVMSDISLDD